jgi:O-antigen/teichoic acid export membrane protein
MATMDRGEKLRVHRGVAWVALASSAVALLDAVGLWIILRTWISPSEFGVASLAVTLFPILDLASDVGLTAAVIQRSDLDKDRLSTVFWLNVALSTAIALLLFPAGHLLAAFHDQPILATLVAAYGIKLMLQNVASIPNALMRRDLRLKELSIIRIFANLAEFAGKVGFAAAGFGVWTFLLAPLCRVTVSTIGLQLRNPWVPKLVLRIRETRGMLHFGLRTTASQILFLFYSNVDYQVVGKFFGTTALGFYRWGFELVLEPVRIISGVATEVAFPLYARLQRRREALAEQLVAFTRQNLVLVIPFLGLILISADDILTVLMGAEWVGAATTARILCVIGLLRAVSLLFIPLLDAQGYPGRTMAYSGLTAVILPIAHVSSAAWLGDEVGYASVAIGWVAGYPFAFALLVYLSLRTIDLPLSVYAARVGGVLVCGVIALVVGLAARWIAIDASPGLRLLAVAAGFVLIFGVLLSRYQGISLRKLRAALRDPAAAP